MLIASMNPCPCGFIIILIRSAPVRRGGSNLNKISGPLLDRIDLHVEVTPVAFSELSSTGKGENSASIRERVIKARDIPSERYKDHPMYANAQMSSKQLREICVINQAGEALLKRAMERLNLVPVHMTAFLKR